MKRPERRMAVTIVAAILAGMAISAPAEARPGGDEAQRDLSVLYVGLDPDEAVPDKLVRYAGEHRARQLELYAERTPAFLALLREHFETVGFVAGDDYDAGLSDDYDVTIFDTLPPILAHGPDGEYQKIRLPEGFDRPSLTVGEVGPFMLGRFGFKYKIDHL